MDHSAYPTSKMVSSSANPFDNLRIDHPHLYLHMDDLPVDRKVKNMPNPITPSMMSLGVRVTNIQIGAPLITRRLCSVQH